MSCCTRGDSILNDLRPTPLALRKLFTDDTTRARSFRTRIRAYNSALAFTSVSYNKDKRIEVSSGIQCFQIHGELFHYQGPLQPIAGKVPAFAQLFFYDPEYSTGLRIDRYPDLDRSILLKLLQMLTDVNPFIDIYKTARERLQSQPPD
jgi:hypothetical protein